MERVFFLPRAFNWRNLKNSLMCSYKRKEFILWLDLKSKAESCGRTGLNQCRFGSEAKRPWLYFILDCYNGSNHVMGPSIWKYLVCVCLARVLSFRSRWITALWRLVLVTAHQQSPWRLCLLFCALIGCSWNILFYLIVCSPATQTPVSQSDAGF